MTNETNITIAPNPAEQLNKAQGDIFGWFRTPKGCPLQGVFIRTNEDSETDIQNAIDMGFSVERLYTAPPSIPTITEADLEKSGLGYPLPKEQAVQLWNKGFRSEPITVLEAWEAIGHDIGCNPSKDELFDSLRNMSSICRAHGCDMPSIPETSVVVERTQAATDVLVERQRQIEKEGWTPEHDDEHSNYEIAGLACFYAMPPGAREWDASSTGYGDTLAEAIIPHGWTVKEGDRRAELIKAGALVLAEIERLDRAILSSKGEGMKLTKQQREELRQKYGGNCAYCGCVLGKSFHADHLVACRRDLVSVQVTSGTFRLQSVGSGSPAANKIENFMPSCAPCNISKSAYTLEGWRFYLEKQIEYLNEYSKKYRMAKAYGLIEETGAKVVFYFEKLGDKVMVPVELVGGDL